MAEKTTNLRVVVDKLMRNPMMADLSWEAAVDYCVDFLGIVGSPKMFVEVSADIPITSYRGVLPSDWVDTIAVAHLGTTTADDTGVGGMPMRHSTGTNMQDADSQSGAVEGTYMIQNSIIVSSLETCILRMSYRAIAVDTEGYPLLIDNPAVVRALSNYIKLQHYTILFEMGKLIPAVYQNLQQQYAWSVGACETEMLRLDLPKAEAFFNSMHTLLIRDNEYNNKFNNNGSKEYIISH